MRTALVVIGVCLAVGGCSSKKSSILLERQAVGPLDEEARVAGSKPWHLDPAVNTRVESGVEIAAHPASLEYLTNLFGNKEIFGEYAGKSPLGVEHLAFYVKIANRSAERIHINPASFILLDDRGNQYYTLGVDPLTALAESRRAWGTARGMLSEARPGYFGIGIPVGKLFTSGSGSQREFALLKLSSIQGGLLYPGVVHDGLVAFWSPHPEAKSLRLLLTDIKTGFDAKDEPQQSIEFTFTFTPTQ